MAPKDARRILHNSGVRMRLWYMHFQPEPLWLLLRFAKL